MAKTRMLSPETAGQKWSPTHFGTGPGCALYRLLADDLSLLYVGISENPRERLRTHAQKQEWWPEVAHLLIVELPSKRRALDLELEAIRIDHPKYNKNGAVQQWPAEE